MHERSDTIVAQALARLRAEDERLGGDAEAALNSLTWDEGLETITQYGLQRFLWYERPLKWMTSLEGKRHLALALGRLLDLWVLRDLARDLGAVRRSGRRLVITRAGRALAGDAEALWRAVAGRLGGGDDFGAIVTELALALLLNANEMLQAELVARVHAAVVGEGWHDRATGRPPDPDDVRRQLAEPLRLPGVLGLSLEGGDWRARTVALTGVSRPTALEALPAHATGPRPDPSRG